jgi:PhnB protein
MAETKLNPYIARDGDTLPMLEFYHQILGGKLDLQTYGESPMPVPDSHKDRILHGVVEVSDFITIMAADSPPDMPLSSTHSNVSLSLSGPEEDRLKKVFAGLADGGKVTMPLEKQFWGDLFGMVDDKFGTHWMVNIGAGVPPAKG